MDRIGEDDAEAACRRWANHQTIAIEPTTRTASAAIDKYDLLGAGSERVELVPLNSVLAAMGSAEFSLTSAIKRYPRRATVSIKRGWRALSPSAFLSC